MTRSENMARLWQDPEFRNRRTNQARAHMQALNAKQWKDPKFIARSTARLLAATRRPDADLPNEAVPVA